MELSEFTFRLLILFFPGIICAYVIDKLTIHKPREVSFFLLTAFVLGLICYFSYWMGIKSIGYIWPNWIDSNVTFLKALTNSNIYFSFREIIVVSLLSVVLACLVSVASKFKLVTHITHFLRITKKFGELDVWGYTLNLKEVVYVTVRDHKNDLVYDGWVQAFSDDSKNAELLLRDVSLYKNSTGERLYQVGAVYLSRVRDDISIECRTFPIDERIKWKEKENNE
jgi:hypothetical protein